MPTRCCSLKMPSRALPWILVLPVLGAPGCQSAHYGAASLPPQFRAAKATGDVTVNLARMASPGYSNAVIGPDDVLEITVVSGHEGERPFPQTVRVAEDGTADIPLVGSVQVGGLDALAASRNISTAAVERGIYRQPHITVDIKTKASNRVTVIGAVEEPGVHELPRGSSDLLSAIAMAGGLSEEAGTEVEILRQSPRSSPTRFAEKSSPEAGPGSEGVQLAAYSQLMTSSSQSGSGLSAVTHQGTHTVKIDLAAASPGTPAHEDYRLEERDVVMVLPKKKQTIHVGGLVKSPGQFELPTKEDLHLLDAIAMAGGIDSMAADKILIIRRVEGNPEPLVINASLGKCKHNGRENLRIAPGDMITVERTPTTVIYDTFTRLINMTIGISNRSSLF